MSIAETIGAVRDAAQMLTRENKVLTFANTEYPLAQFAETYNIDEAPEKVEMTDELAVAVENHFGEVNEETTPIEDDSREQLVENIHLGLSKTLFTTNNVIIPAIKDMHSYFSGLQSRTSQPEYRVEPFVYASIHDDPALVNHVNTRYSNVRPQQTYKTYRLEQMTAEDIISAVSVNNPHIDQEQATEWALQLGAERIESVWSSLFGNGGEVSINSLPYMTLQAAPFNTDDITLAYFLCGHYMENPQVVQGMDVSGPEWTIVMQMMHECFGFYLGRAYLNRLDMRERGELILRNEATNPIETRRAVVIVNNDVSAPWLNAGGDIQAILGAAVENPGITNVEAISKNSDAYVRRWLSIYPLIKQAAIDYADRHIRNDVITTFLRMARETSLKDITVDEVDLRMQAAMRTLSRDDLRNAYKTFSTLIVEVYYPNSNYKAFLEAIDEYGEDFPGATIRELNTQAIITLTAIFLAKQVKSEKFEPEIDPNAVARTEIVEDDMDTGILAVEMGEEDAPEAPDIVVEGVEVEGSDDTPTDEEPVTEGDLELDEDDYDPYADLDDTTEVEETGDELADDTEVADESNSEEEESEEDESEEAEDDEISTEKFTDGKTKKKASPKR